MSKYHIRFNGRRRGAIGQIYMIEATVEATSDASAILALYDNYQDVMGAKEIMADGTYRNMSYVGAEDEDEN
jgi:AMMECR1 domain-containing protein